MTIEQFSARLREETSSAHTLAENVGFVRGFLKGTISREAYIGLLSKLYLVYSTLEASLRECRDLPNIKEIYFPELERRATLEKDLQFFAGEEAEKHKQQWTPAVIAYTSRLKEVAEQQPFLLVAHSYVRYMGDLSGGQILKKITERTLKLKNGEGLAFYEFTEIENPASFKKKYRQRLDELDLSDEEKQAIIEEANLAFRLNMAMFDELEGSTFKAFAGALFPFGKK